jgi:hypothetical protein
MCDTVEVPLPLDPGRHYYRTRPHMGSEANEIGDLVAFEQAVGVLSMRGCISVEDATEGLTAVAAVLGVNRHALARLVVSAVNERGRH